MYIRALLLIIVGLLSLHLLSWPTCAETKDTEKLIKSITSVAAAKSQLRDTLEGMASCNIGSCLNYASKHFCEIIGVLDLKVNGAIFGTMSMGKSELTITAEDLRQMKKMAAQCKPTNYQYWQYESILHVGYNPSTQADAEIRQYLGVKRK